MLLTREFHASMRQPNNHICFCRWIIIFALFLIHYQLSAQSSIRPFKAGSVTFEHIGEEYGLNSHISWIFEDHLGYLWFGAGPEGLYRFNGYEFDHYEYIVGDTSSLPHNIVANILHEDSKGNLWLYSGGAITRYNRASNDFSRLSHLKKEIPYDAWASIGSVAEDREGNIWLSAYGNSANPQSGGLIVMDPDTDRITLYQHDPADSSSLCSYCVSHLFIDSKGVLWVGSCGNGVDRFVPSSNDLPGHFVHYRHRMEDTADFIHTTIREILEDKEGSLWFIAGRNDVLRYHKEEDRIRRYRIDPLQNSSEEWITTLSIDPNGGIWIGTSKGFAWYNPDTDGFELYKDDPEDSFSISNGVVKDIDFGEDGCLWMIIGNEEDEHSMTRFDPRTGSFHEYKTRKEDPQSLSTGNLNSALVDRNGILWIATADGGINKSDPHRYKFSSLYSGKSEKEDLHPERILSLCLDQKDRLWIGTDGKGLYSYDRIAGTTASYPYESSDPGALKSRRIYSIIENPAGILWIGGDSGLNRLDTRTLETEHFWPDPYKQAYLGPNYIRDLYPDSAGNIWIATMHGGLVSFDIETRNFSFHQKSEKNPGGVPVSGLMSVYVDEVGTVWTGSLGGLHKYKPGNQEQASSNIRYYSDPAKQHSISADMIGDIIPDKSGNLWIATGGGGLNKLDVERGEFIQYTTRQGLLSNTITNLWMDSNGKLWLGSFSGVEMFDPMTESCIVYDRSDGLSSREITQGSGFTSSSGEIFFAGPGGINFFHPDSLTKNDYIPPVVISRMLLFENPLLPGTEARVELEHDENFLTLEFAALNYSNSHKNQYRYRMIGLDPDTVSAGTRRYASYTNMKPGNYTFWITGSNNDGIWNPQGTTLEILIHPPWWRSDLVIGLYILLFITGLLGIIRWRTWKLLNDRKILEQQVKQRTHDIEEKDRHILEMDRMKTRFFANISHEFRTPLTLIISPLEEIIARRKQDDPELKKLGIIRRNSQRLLSLVNQLLDLSKLDSGKLKLELVKANVVRNLKLTCASFISLAEKNRIRYSYHLPEIEYVTYFDAGKLETILINLISNAFKYTPREGSIECYARIEEVNTESDDDQVPVRLTVSVIDSGPGIEPEKLKRIFDRFYQGDEQHQTEGGGSGIGLSLTRELVELIHGEITVSSEPGKGSCFEVIIPLGKEHLKESEYLIREETLEEGPHMLYPTSQLIHPEESDEEAQEGGAIQAKESIHLLIVEDNDDLRSYLKEQLQSTYTIVEAAAGDEGLSRALKHIPDLIITDVMMPVMDGIELCKRLKSNERTSHIPVIMLTAKADFDSRISGLETGADDYILKPFQIRELRTRVFNLIRQRNMLRERFSGNMEAIAEDIALNSYDVKFIRRVTEVVEDHLTDLEFDVRKLQEKSGMSHTQLYRKLHALTGLSPSRFIRHLRLKRAAKLLEQRYGSVTQVAFEVGFGNLSYFTKCFRKQFGISPSEYSKQYD